MLVPYVRHACLELEHKGHGLIRPCGELATYRGDDGVTRCFNHASMRAFSRIHVMRGNCAGYQAWIGHARLN